MEHMGTILDGRLRVALCGALLCWWPESGLKLMYCGVWTVCTCSPVVSAFSFHLSATTSGVAHLNVENFQHRHSTATAILSYIEVYPSHPSQLLSFRASWSCTFLLLWVQATHLVGPWPTPFPCSCSGLTFSWKAWRRQKMKCSVGLMRHPGIFLVICVQNEWQTAIMLSGGCNACSQEDVRSLALAIRFLSCGRRDGDTS